MRKKLSLFSANACGKRASRGVAPARMAFCRLSGSECRKQCPRSLPTHGQPTKLSPEPLDPVAALNRRWAFGRPSNSLVAAGVLMHQFVHTTGLGKQPWVTHNTHVSCSLANRHVPWLYSPSAAGVVLSPHHASVKCLYASDGGTFKTPDGCGRRAHCTARKWWMCNYPPAYDRAIMLARTTGQKRPGLPQHHSLVSALSAISKLKWLSQCCQLP